MTTSAAGEPRLLQSGWALGARHSNAVRGRTAKGQPPTAERQSNRPRAHETLAFTRQKSAPHGFSCGKNRTGRSPRSAASRVLSQRPVLQNNETENSPDETRCHRKRRHRKGRVRAVLSAKRGAADGPQSIGLMGEPNRMQVGRQAGQKEVNTRVDS